MTTKNTKKRKPAKRASTKASNTKPRRGRFKVLAQFKVLSLDENGTPIRESTFHASSHTSALELFVTSDDQGIEEGDYSPFTINLDQDPMEYVQAHGRVIKILNLDDPSKTWTYRVGIVHWEPEFGFVEVSQAQG